MLAVRRTNESRGFCQVRGGAGNVGALPVDCTPVATGSADFSWVRCNVRWRTDASWMVA